MAYRRRVSTPELFPPAPLLERSGRPTGRVIVAAEGASMDPAFFEWELCAAEWSDEHPHDEWVFVLDGELVVEAGGTSVTCTPGALVRVPAGERGMYRAPVHARMLSIYGPRPSGPADPRGRLRPLG
jgi:mannose-6-phosphate isomerase-like protein (cupin superfamily)